MRSARLPLALPVLLLACSHATPRTVGPWTLTPTNTGFDVSRDDGADVIGSISLEIGVGSADVTFETGAYKFDNETVAWAQVGPAGKPLGLDPSWTWELDDADGNAVGQVNVADLGNDTLSVLVAATDPSINRTRYAMPCTGDDHFAGFGEMAEDVDHVGESFPLWVSEPGIGKSTTDSQGSDWFLTGTKHASSYPDPFFVTPAPLGVEIVTQSRVDMDLCTGNDWSAAVWSGKSAILYEDVASPMEAIEQHALRNGPPVLPPDWAFAPWNDAVGGVDRVTTVATELRDAHATSGVIWTEDWKGGEEGAYGYHLIPNWDIDEALYPDAAGTAAALKEQGFAWFAYFQPFVVEGTPAWDEASSYLIQNADGTPYTFTGMTLATTSVLDLSRDDARAWAESKMQAVLDLGFTGWMADFGEWLPTDAHLQYANALTDHNAYPIWWQETNAAVLNGSANGGNSATGAGGTTTGVMFTRSGWTGSPGISPVAWGGDQRTDFEADDGFPTVLPLGIGAGIAGVPLFGTDIGGYQSIGNPSSTKELWWRWCTLGAMSPVMRTHHGAFLDTNWQFDTDADTLALYARWSNVHGRLIPYLRGLAAQAATVGTPLIRAPFLTYPAEDWGRTDAWLLGDLLVAPVMTEGAVSRQVDLPAGVNWYDFWTGAPAVTGTHDVPLDSIAVFAPAGTIVPMYTDAPDTLVAGSLPGLLTADDVDKARTVYVYASGAGAMASAFTEGDGTTYSVSGTATGPAVGAVTTSQGTATVGGLAVAIAGPSERSYTIVIY